MAGQPGHLQEQFHETILGTAGARLGHQAAGSTPLTKVADPGQARPVRRYDHIRFSSPKRQESHRGVRWSAPPLAAAERRQPSDNKSSLGTENMITSPTVCCAVAALVPEATRPEPSR